MNSWKWRYSVNVKYTQKFEDLVSIRAASWGSGLMSSVIWNCWWTSSSHQPGACCGLQSFSRNTWEREARARKNVQLEVAVWGVRKLGCRGLLRVLGMVSEFAALSSNACPCEVQLTPPGFQWAFIGLRQGEWLSFISWLSRTRSEPACLGTAVPGLGHWV